MFFKEKNNLIYNVLTNIIIDPKRLLACQKITRFHNYSTY
jgi:hypothetical protein